LSVNTNNLIFGESKNPLNHERSCGGSSGGDAGLVAARCVPISLGTDIGGSLRFPASFCGIYGFKPSNGRVSRSGLSPARILRYTPYLHLTGIAGPMGSSV
jgi:Asp-tRNA(Asn)/Glu-tRNA(Gln) amidotransferase A subunit family amidase